jgi:hypothetical protein
LVARFTSSTITSTMSPTLTSRGMQPAASTTSRHVDEAFYPRLQLHEGAVLVRVTTRPGTLAPTG